MKFVVLACLVAYVAADVSHLVNPDSMAQIKEQTYDFSPEGNYEWSYKTENGISADARGILKNAGGETPSQETRGEFSYTSSDGQQINLQYVADENGFQPQGSHLPTSPPIPEAIIRALEYIRAHPPQPEKK